MAKRFNTTGVCIDKKHYMINIDNKLNKIDKLINKDAYFTINRPRQFGKTTTLSQLYKRLSSQYLIIRTSFEGVGDAIFETEERFSRNILSILSDALELHNEKESIILREISNGMEDLNQVSKSITKFIKSVDKEVILIIDEVDKSTISYF